MQSATILGLAAGIALPTMLVAYNQMRAPSRLTNLEADPSVDVYSTEGGAVTSLIVRLSHHGARIEYQITSRSDALIVLNDSALLRDLEVDRRSRIVSTPGQPGSHPKAEPPLPTVRITFDGAFQERQRFVDAIER